MPADHKVSVAWQIVATFVPIANFWAFYQVRKLRKYLLYVLLPAIVLSFGIIGTYSFSLKTDGNLACDLSVGVRGIFQWQDVARCYHTYLLITYGPSLAFQGFAIYLVIVWSRQHNRKFDTPTASTA
jgi:hypothetical protein